MKLFYKPEHGTVGDVIPFYDQGEFKPFYLKGDEGYYGEDGSSGWTMLTTKDHLHFTEQPTGIHGGTGSVLKVDDLYHLFYCRFTFEPQRQYVCHAVSKDLTEWKTLPEYDFGPDGVIYELTDWRDPFVFYNEETGEWWMLLAARQIGKTMRNGCTGLAVSTDLYHWDVRESFYAPHIHTGAHECPDLFRMGDWYYLLYSQYTDRFETRYRMSRTLNGPWIAPARDTFDTRCFYAAKTGTDGKDRYIYGWNPTRVYNLWGFNPRFNPGHDYNSFDWGDTMIVHKLEQRPDGTLTVRVPESVDAALTVRNELRPDPANGDWTIGSARAEEADNVTSGRPEGDAYSEMAGRQDVGQREDRTQNRTAADFSVALNGNYGTCFLRNRVPEVCKLEMEIVLHEGVREAGVALQIDEDFDKGYYLSLQPGRNRLEFKTGMRMYAEGGWSFPYDVEMERPIALALDVPHKVKVFVQGTILVCYVDDEIALNARMYDNTNGYFGLFASDGNVEFKNVRLWT